MGLKGLQIAGNSLVPMMLHKASPLVEHFPTYAEQFNQNVNGLSWGSANLAWESVTLFREYLAINLLFAIQACDLRAFQLYENYDGRNLLGSELEPIYSAVLETLACRPGEQFPLLYEDSDRCLEDDVSKLSAALLGGGELLKTVQPIVHSFERELEQLA